jgi:hypothetical protein
VTRHGHGLLDELRALQLAMVDGQVPEGILRRLAGLVDGLRPSAADARLDAVLDAIELRAAVELAKLRRGGDCGRPCRARSGTRVGRRRRRGRVRRAGRRGRVRRADSVRAAPGPAPVAGRPRRSGGARHRDHGWDWRRLRAVS